MLKSLVQVLHDTVYEVSRDFKVLHVFPAAGSPKFLHTKNLLPVLSHEAAVPLLEAVQKAYELGQLQEVEFHSIFCGKVFYFLGRANKTHRNTIFLLIRDITSIKQHEADLIKQTELLAASNQDLERFAYIASHDLKEPLRAIRGFANALCEDYGQKLDVEAISYISFIVEGAERLQRLVDDLLDFSKAQTSDLHLENVNLNSVLEDVLNDLQKVFEEKHVEIEYGRLPLVFADYGLLYRVVLNLVSNAIKFVPKSKNPKIRITSQLHDVNTYKITVSDNGIGIPKHQFEQIFKPFQRLHSQNVYPGSGIGLSIVQRIVSRLGGQVYLESVVDQGSDFSFTIRRGNGE